MSATYTQVAEYAGWLNLTDWGVLQVRGADNLRFLQAQITNDLRPLQPGEGVFTFFCTPTGHVLSDGMVLRTPHEALLILPPETHASILARLNEAIILDEVEILPQHDALGLISLQGSQVDAVLEELELEPPPAEPLRHHMDSWQGAEIRLIRHDRTGFGGVDLLVPYAVLEQFQTALVATACLQIEEPLAEVLRYEAGIPRWGVDMDSRTLAAEMGEPIVRSHISYTKGCYVGQEVLMRIHARGHTNRTWVPLRVEGDTLPPRGATLGAEDRPDAGVLTGAVRSPALGDAILAWGFVRNAYTQPGTTLTLQTEPPAHATVLPHAPRPAAR